MSYILDALKKADAARERESVPGLHSRHDAPLSDDDDDDPDTTAPALAGARRPGSGSRPAQGVVAGMAGGAALVALVALLAWWWLPDAAAPPVATGVAVTSSPQPIAPSPASSAPVAPLQPPPPPPPQAQAQAEATTPVADAAIAPTPQAKPATLPRETTARKPAEQAPLRVDPSLKDPLPRVVSYQELPEDIKRELPTLNVGGAMHSEVAANRMLILNGGLFREGEQPAPGLVLEEIKLKSAVFSYKGHRYSVAY